MNPFHHGAEPPPLSDSPQIVTKPRAAEEKKPAPLAELVTRQIEKNEAVRAPVDAPPEEDRHAIEEEARLAAQRINNVAAMRALSAQQNLQSLGSALGGLGGVYYGRHSPLACSVSSTSSTLAYIAQPRGRRC